MKLIIFVFLIIFFAIWSREAHDNQRDIEKILKKLDSLEKKPKWAMFTNPEHSMTFGLKQGDTLIIKSHEQ